ncbi:MAG: hypothetical protein HY700_01440 [Gemmatimonadetes bacterium]|nr:hypothetical protein [Gemmatimonadota bacterium]
MTFGQFATAAGAPAKWVQNAIALLKLPRRYTLEAAKVLGLAYELVRTCGIPLARAHPLAKRALAAWPAQREWIEEGADGSVRIVIDLERALSNFAVHLSLSRSYYAERQRGRPRKRRRGGAIARAREYGVDISLLEENLKRTPEERLRNLEEAVEFLKNVRVTGP